jgi:hypothetical protein
MHTEREEERYFLCWARFLVYSLTYVVDAVDIFVFNFCVQCFVLTLKHRCIWIVGGYGFSEISQNRYIIAIIQSPKSPWLPS